MIQYKTMSFGFPQRWHVVDLAQGIDVRSSVADYDTRSDAREHSDRLNAALSQRGTTLV